MSGMIPQTIGQTGDIASGGRGLGSSLQKIKKPGGVSDVSTGQDLSQILQSLGMGGATQAQAQPQVQQPASQTGANSRGNFSGEAYGNKVNPDGSFNKPDGTYDWVEGAGPQHNWKGEDARTGLTPIGTEPAAWTGGKGQGHRDAAAARQAWIEQNRAAGRTLADLGLEPLKGGGLSNYMRYAGTPRGTADGSAGTTTPVVSTPITGGGLVSGGTTTTATKIGGNPVAQDPGMVTNSLGFGTSTMPNAGIQTGSIQPGANQAQKRVRPVNQMGSLGFGAQPSNIPGQMRTTAKPLNTARIG